MKYHHPLKQILSLARPYWDRSGTRDAVRRAFRKALQCQSPQLGAEVYGLGDQELVVYHTCKSPACPSCGYRRAIQWLRERWAALPDVSYKGITFTMPKVLWPLFRDNPALAKALPALAAVVIQTAAMGKHGLRVGIIAILHTFNGPLDFNSHVHTMVTAGGVRGSAGVWVSSVYYDRVQLMESWRKAVLKLLRAALKAGQLRSEMTISEVEATLINQENTGWILKIQSFKSRAHYLQYAGRYIRRAPIAQRRITYIGEGVVRFGYKDKKLRRRVEVQCSLEEFIDRWAQHMREYYQHGVQGFGLFAPRVLRQTSAAVFAILGQEPRPRPKQRPWADSLKRDFGRDPLLLPTGERMHWVRRLAPKTSFRNDH